MTDSVTASTDHISIADWYSRVLSDILAKQDDRERAIAIKQLIIDEAPGYPHVIRDKSADPDFLFLNRALLALNNDRLEWRFLSAACELLDEAVTVGTSTAVPGTLVPHWPHTLFRLLASYVANTFIESWTRTHITSSLLATLNSVLPNSELHRGIVTDALHLLVELRPFLEAEYWLFYQLPEDQKRTLIVFEALCINNLDRALRWMSENLTSEYIITAFEYNLPCIIDEWNYPQVERHVKRILLRGASPAMRRRLNTVWTSLGLPPLILQKQHRNNALVYSNAEDSAASGRTAVESRISPSNSAWLQSPSALRTAVITIRAVPELAVRMKWAIQFAEASRIYLRELLLEEPTTVLDEYVTGILATQATHTFRFPLDNLVDIALCAAEPRLWLDDRVFTSVMIGGTKHTSPQARLRPESIALHTEWEDLFNSLPNNEQKPLNGIFDYYLIQHLPGVPVPA